MDVILVPPLGGVHRSARSGVSVLGDPQSIE